MFKIDEYRTGKVIRAKTIMFKIDVSVPQNEQIVGVKELQRTGDLLLKNLSEQCVEKIISVSENAHPGIRGIKLVLSQSMLRKLVAYYMRQAIRSDRTTVYNAIKDAGHPQLAELIRRL